MQLMLNERGRSVDSRKAFQSPKVTFPYPREVTRKSEPHQSQSLQRAQPLGTTIVQTLLLFLNLLALTMYEFHFIQCTEFYHLSPKKLYAGLLRRQHYRLLDFQTLQLTWMPSIQMETYSNLTILKQNNTHANQTKPR